MAAAHLLLLTEQFSPRAIVLLRMSGAQVLDAPTFEKNDSKEAKIFLN